MSKPRRDRPATRAAALPAARPDRRAGTWSWGGVADAVGHCVVLFAFVPALAALPRWLYVEATNPLNREDLVVLAFLPARAAILLLNTFLAGAIPGVVGGLIAGGLLSAWVAARGRPADRRHEIAVGAGCGAVAAALMVVVTVAFEVSQGRPAPARLGAVGFEIVSGTVCGALAVTTAMRLLTAHRTSVSASQ